MANRASSASKLQRQMADMQLRLSEAEDTLEAIRSGAVDALIVHTPRGEQLFTLKGADQTYRVLVEAMSEGAVTLKRGIISYCNTRFAALIRTPLEKVFGASVFDFVESSEFSALLRRLHNGKASRGSLEGALRAADGTRVPVLLSASRFVSEGAATVSVVVTDITDRQRTEEALRLSERRFQTVARTASDAIWDWDLQENRIWRSEGFVKVFGYRSEDLKQPPEWWRSRVHPDDRKHVLAAFWSAVHGRGNLYTATYRFRRGDGSWAHVADRGWVLRDAYQKAVRVIGARRDITEQMATERARQELSRSILNAQERERQRVARDLHDSVNQLLASAKFRLGSLAARDHDAGVEVRQVLALVDRAIGEVRSISRNLRPGELDDLGLIAALRSLAHEFGKRTGIASRFKSDPPQCPRGVTKEVEMTVYRIAQEALNNVEKHSRAARVELALNCTRQHVVLTVRDNGRGFVPRAASPDGTSWGLQNMTERAALLGGNFEIRSPAGRGTKISVRIPFGKRSRAKSRSAR